MLPNKSLLYTGRFTEYFNHLENLKNTKVEQDDQMYKLNKEGESIHDIIIEADYRLCRGKEAILCDCDALSGYTEIINKLKEKEKLSSKETFICSLAYYRLCRLHLKLRFITKAEIYFEYYESFYLLYMKQLDEEIKLKEPIKHSFVEVSYSDVEEDSKTNEAQTNQHFHQGRSAKTELQEFEELKLKKEYIESKYNLRKAWFYHLTNQDEKALDVLINLYKSEKKIKLKLKDPKEQFKLPIKFRVNVRISKSLQMISEIYKKRFEYK